MDCLRKIAERMPCLETLERRTGIKKEYSVFLFGVFFLITIMATSLGPIITSTVGIMVPLQETLVILKQVNPKKDEMRHMLVFWMIFGLLTSFDIYSGPITSLVPLWYTIKFFLLLWIGPLKFKAGLFIYDNVIARIPEGWYTESCGIENAVKEATDAVKSVAEEEAEKEKSEINRKTD